MTADHICPRRRENPMIANSKYPQTDTWRADGACSYCGSLNPDALIARLESGDVKITATDKNYKIYVENNGGADFMRTHRTDNNDFAGWDSPIHTWFTEKISQAKFYFQHFSTAQKQRFCELLNEKKVVFNGSRFYVMPYFVTTFSDSAAE